MKEIDFISTPSLKPHTRGIRMISEANKHELIKHVMNDEDADVVEEYNHCALEPFKLPDNVSLPFVYHISVYIRA